MKMKTALWQCKHCLSENVESNLEDSEIPSEENGKIYYECLRCGRDNMLSHRDVTINET